MKIFKPEKLQSRKLSNQKTFKLENLISRNLFDQSRKLKTQKTFGPEKFKTRKLSKPENFQTRKL